MDETYVTVLVDLEQVAAFNSIYGKDKWGPKGNPVNVDAFTRFLVGAPFYGETRDLHLPPGAKIKWQGVDVSTCNKLFDNQKGEKITMEARDADGKPINVSKKGWNKIFDLDKSPNASVTKKGRLVIKQAKGEDNIWVITQKKLDNCNIKYDIDFEFKYKGMSKYAKIDPAARSRPYYP